MLVMGAHFTVFVVLWVFEMFTKYQIKYICTKIVSLGLLERIKPSTFYISG